MGLYRIVRQEDEEEIYLYCWCYYCRDLVFVKRVNNIEIEII